MMQAKKSPYGAARQPDQVMCVADANTMANCHRSPNPACRNERRQRARRGGKPGSGQVVDSVGFCCPVAPKNSGPQGRWQSKAGVLRAASNAREAASKEHDTRPVAKVSGVVCVCWFSWPPDLVTAFPTLPGRAK